MEVVKLIEGDDLAIILPTVHEDNRGYFYETYNEKEFNEKVCEVKFVQDNQSESAYGTLRGFHFQKPPYEQAKLVRVTSGMALDVALDIRENSPTYGRYYYTLLSGRNKRQFFIPKGFAHAFLALQDNTVLEYKCDNFYNKESEDGLYYDDPLINFPWGAFIEEDKIILSKKDRNRPLLKPLTTETEPDETKPEENKSEETKAEE